MEKLTQFAVHNSRLTILFLVLVVVFGALTFVTMPSREDPEITIRTAQVSAKYPGMSVTLMEDLIARPLERKIKEIAELDSIETTVQSGLVTIQVNIKDRYFDLDPIWQDLRNKMDDMRSSLPSGTLGPVVNDDYGNVVSASIAVFGRGYDMRELREVAEDLQDTVSVLGSVSKVDVYGVQDERIYLEFNSSRLAYFGISPAEVIRAIQKQNIVLPGGSLKDGTQRIEIEPTGNFESVEEIENVQLQIPGSEQTIYLRDIVTLHRIFVDPPENPVFLNGQPAIVLGVSMVPNFNIDVFGREITSLVEREQLQLPAGLQIEFATYQPTLVQKAVDGAVSNLYQTIAVVVGVVILFLGVRTGLIVGTIVPLTILMSLIAMNAWGVELHSMSVAAIIIALGLLVDNGIVIAEDIQRRLSDGMGKLDAGMASARTLGMPLLTSSLTTIIAFAPLMMAENVVGEYLSSLGQVIITTLLSSWFLALVATPVFCLWFLKPDGESRGGETGETGVMHSTYNGLLSWLLRYKVSFIVLMILLLIVAGGTFNYVTKQLLPYSDRNQILVYVDLPAGSDINTTISVTRRMMSWLADEELNPEVENHIAYIGFGGPRFYLALSPPDPGRNVAFLVVNTRTAEQVPELIDRIDRFALDELPEAKARAKQMWMGGNEIGIVEYKIKGPDSLALYRHSFEVEKALLGIPGTIGITSDWQNPITRVRVDIDQNRARRAGVSSESIAQELSTFYDGAQISDFREDDKIIPIVLRGDVSSSELSDLLTLPVLSDKGVPVPLLQVADFSTVIEPGRLIRKDQERTLTVSAKHRWLQASDLNALMEPSIAGLELPEGYTVELGGEIADSSKANSALFDNAPIALAVIAILLVWQFNSFRRPAIILMTIPLVLIGAVSGLLIMDAFFSFTAMLGLFSLAGIIINNGIVLIDRIDQERESGQPIQDAVQRACLARLRPIFMTTLTTILGLIPMLLFGGALWYPMAVVIMFGLAVGTILTLGFVPALYLLLFREGKVTA